MIRLIDDTDYSTVLILQLHTASEYALHVIIVMTKSLFSLVEIRDQHTYVHVCFTMDC